MTKLRKRVENFVANLHHETEHGGKVVKLITLEEVGALHEVAAKTAWKHFKNLTKTKVDGVSVFRYGRDYFFASKDTGLVYKAVSTLGRSRRSKSLILLTERGYLKMVQRFSDVRAAFIQDMLVESYFRLKEAAAAGQLLMKENEALRLQLSILQQQVQLFADDRGDLKAMVLGLVDVNVKMASLAGQMLAQRKQQTREETALNQTLEDFPLFRSGDGWRN